MSVLTKQIYKLMQLLWRCHRYIQRFSKIYMEKQRLKYLKHSWKKKHEEPLHLILRFTSEKAMATHSSTLARKLQWTEEPGRLQSMESRRVRHDWATSLSLFTFMQWRRKWQPTPAFLPGESQGRRSLVGCHLRGRTVRHDWSNLAAAAAA